MGPKIGLIGIVGDEIKKDPWGTLRRVADIGYQGIESPARIAERVELPREEFRQKLGEMGLEAVAQGGVFLPGDDEKVESAIEAADAMDADYIVTYWGPCESREQLLEQAEFLDAAGARCREAGLTLCYHNHNHEFATFDGDYGLDVLLGNTHPDNVQCELDVAWVTYGGADPAQMIRRYAGRCPILHVKDFASVPDGGATGNDERGEHDFTEVGTGVVDIPAVVDAALDCDVRWLVVEQDRMRDLPPMESIRVSYQNLSRLLS
ncbi:MAG: sugar phosphate isomerase/epimerase [Candidatus Brocadiia bacterium]